MREAFITPDGLVRLTEELEHLSQVGRQEVADRIRHAVSTDANAGENADYQAAREEQALLERRIAILQERIASAQLVEPDASNGSVDVGERGDPECRLADQLCEDPSRTESDQRAEHRVLDEAGQELGRPLDHRLDERRCADA